MFGPGLRERKLVSEVNSEDGSFISLEQDPGCRQRFPKLQCSRRGSDTNATVVSVCLRVTEAQSHIHYTQLPSELCLPISGEPDFQSNITPTQLRHG